MGIDATATLLTAQNVKMMYAQTVNALLVRRVFGLIIQEKHTLYKDIFMPVKKVKGGYKWGTTGKVYKTKKAATKQARAAYANGYKGKKRRK